MVTCPAYLLYLDSSQFNLDVTLLLARIVGGRSIELFYTRYSFELAIQLNNYNSSHFAKGVGAPTNNKLPMLQAFNLSNESQRLFKFRGEKRGHRER